MIGAGAGRELSFEQRRDSGVETARAAGAMVAIDRAEQVPALVAIAAIGVASLHDRGDQLRDRSIERAVWTGAPPLSYAPKQSPPRVV